VLTVWDSKFGKSREVPLHPSALAALGAYAQRRDQLYPVPRTASFFVSPAGERLVYNTVQATFSRVVRDARVGPRPPLRRARLHDMRH
jgi:integrase